MKPPIDPYAFERLRVLAQELRRRIARATELCEDRMDIDDNGNPDFAMRVVQILKGNDPC